jgi:hypothetical protein
MDLLANQTNFKSLSLKDLLEARNLYHWTLINKANVIGTAVGLYLIRKSDPWPKQKSHENDPSERRSKGVRTFENSEVRPYSWPCILVLVRDWLDATEFGRGGLDPDRMVPRTLYLPDGRAAPVCVVAVEPAEAVSGAPADVRWPESYIGGGCPIIAEVQGVERSASVGCLVSDGHKLYALTNRHVSGEPGSIVKARVRGNLIEVGRASEKQLTRELFSTVFPEFPGRRTYLTLDIGLIEVDNVNDWSSQPYGLEEKVGDVADFNELNLGLQLIDQPVRAFGAASGALDGRIKALFYRHKSMAGYDYISEFLIAPKDGQIQTRPGDSGTVWHLKTMVGRDRDHLTPLLRPMAVEWGGQSLLGSGGQRFNFALATGLSTACQLLDVDLVRDHNTGPNPYWGQTGHYSIATVAISSVQNPNLRAFLLANVERISFRPDQLSPEEIRQKLSGGDFVELADTPDLVWKKTPDRVPGGRDVAQNSGPEHPTHYADIDEPDAKGQTLRDLTLADKAKMDVAVWSNWYVANGKTQARSQGLLPFRVWQFFDEMVRALRAGEADRFLCAAGIVSHYVGDASQPLHGSYFSDGYRDPQDPHAKTWPGKGVHSTYEDKMIDRHSEELLSRIGPEAAAFGGQIPRIADGRDAAFATVVLMSQVAEILPPATLCDEYIRLGGGSSARVVDGLWEAFGKETAQVMGAGARYLATIWDAAYAVAASPLPADAGVISERTLAAIYQDNSFVPSLTLDRIGAVLR